MLVVHSLVSSISLLRGDSWKRWFTGNTKLKVMQRLFRCQNPLRIQTVTQWEIWCRPVNSDNSVIYLPDPIGLSWKANGISVLSTGGGYPLNVPTPIGGVVYLKHFTGQDGRQVVRYVSSIRSANVLYGTWDTGPADLHRGEQLPSTNRNITVHKAIVSYLIQYLSIRWRTVCLLRPPQDGIT